MPILNSWKRPNLSNSRNFCQSITVVTSQIVRIHVSFVSSIWHLKNPHFFCWNRLFAYLTHFQRHCRLLKNSYFVCETICLQFSTLSLGKGRRLRISICWKWHLKSCAQKLPRDLGQLTKHLNFRQIWVFWGQTHFAQISSVRCLL